jgi:hypothetical protein
MKNTILKLLICLFLFTLCVESTHGTLHNETDKSEVNEKRPSINYMLFKGTKAWKLTKAVQKGDTESIKQIVKKSPKLLNYRTYLWQYFN